MSVNLVLVSGPFVRAFSWNLTANYLRDLGCFVQAPDVLADYIDPPAWSHWTSHLLRHISPVDAPILVGHSSAGPLVADLASKMACRSIIIVDGHIPLVHGLAPPVRPALYDFISGLEAPGGFLPIWSKWFSDDEERQALIGLDRLASDPLGFAEFERGLRRFPISWIDDAIELSNWDHVPAGFIQTSALYEYAAEEARRRGWPVTTLQGTHLHPLLEPDETGRAIFAMIRRLAAH